MASRRASRREEKEAVKVYCCDCLHFKRDTSGPSRSHDTGEYYMGECLLGLNPDHTLGKQFANKPRICGHYTKKN